jgi:hypothetical protein
MPVESYYPPQYTLSVDFMKEVDVFVVLSNMQTARMLYTRGACCDNIAGYA